MRSIATCPGGRSAKQRRQHFLQAADQMVGLASTFGQILDLIILSADLAAEEFVLPFKTCDIPRHELIVSRGRPRLATACRTSSSFMFVPNFLIMRCHDKPRLAAAGLGLSPLLDVRNVPINRCPL